jgi:hypothetical protein
MRKSLKRVLDRLRTATSGSLRKAGSVRRGLQLPQRMQALSLSTRTWPVR